MATLTETAYYTRRGFKITFFVIVGLLLLKVVLNVTSSIWQGLRPTQEPKPNVAFGKLPPIQFPYGKGPEEPITYTPEFVGGVLPESSSSARVFFTPKPAPNFLSLGRAQEFAAALSFEAEPVAISQTIYQWTDKEFPLRTLQKDIVNGNFNLGYDFFKDPTVLRDKNLPYGVKAISEAMGTLQNHTLNSSDLEIGNAVVSFWQSTGSGLTPAPSVSEADITRVDFFRSPLDKHPLVTPTYKEGPVYFLFSGSSGKKRILTWHYAFKTAERDIFATYPLKTTQDAWNDLEAGRGFIANWGAVKGTHVTIRKMSLAYYDSSVYEPYIQPIFVFEGDQGFIVYVPAVAKELASSSGD